MTKNYRSAIVLGVLALLGVTRPARAQEVTRMPDTSRHAIGVDAGFENAFITRATYTYRLDPFSTLEPRVYGRFTLPSVKPDLGDWALDGGFRFTPLSWGDLKLSLAGGPIVRHTVNEAFSATAIGVTTTMLAGYEGPSWGLSAEMGYEQIFATHIKNSDAYKDTFYSDAKDGWYSITGSSAHVGLRGGARIGSVEIGARAGINTTGRLNPVMPPFYFTLGAAYSF